jgi:drug/metabolite transporter (DMT)-like permease
MTGPTNVKVLGLLIGFVGVAMLSWGKASFKPDASGLSSGWAVVACLVACLCYGLSASYTQTLSVGCALTGDCHWQPVRRKPGPGAADAVVLAEQTPPASQPGWRCWRSGVLCTGIAYVLYFRLIEKRGAAGALTVTFLVPVFAVLYGVIFLNESVTSWMLLCAAIILCGTALSAGVLKLRRHT